MLSFLRNPETHRRTLNEFFQRTGCDYSRFNYLGEWHSHPSFSARPSATDIRTMTEIVETRSSAISFAVLLVVRLRWRFWIDHSLTIFARDQPPRESRVRPRIVRI
jgi:integrative and conjugative element protein (TIGR02256 family)